MPYSLDITGQDLYNQIYDSERRNDVKMMIKIWDVHKFLSSVTDYFGNNIIWLILII